MARRIRRDSPLGVAARVAAVTTAIAAMIYIVAAVAVISVVAHFSALNIDAGLEGRLHALQRHPELLLVQPRHFPPDAPGLEASWLIASDGSELVTPPDAPALPATLANIDTPTTATIDGREYRLVGGAVASPSGDAWAVVGVQTAPLQFAVRAAAVAAFVLGVPILGMIFLAALAIGRWSAAPIERGRQRVLEFTADASHELRTPLQVIEAEVSLALMQDRDAASYRRTIESVERESERLRRMVDDLLWLARFDSRPAGPSQEMVDLRALAIDAAERFDALARRRGQSIERATDGPEPALVMGPAEWLDRLLGVLIDNACRYTPEGGRILVAVQVKDGQVELRVDDSGPGTPAAERSRIFDRFRRATEHGGGAGLGLAIGNAVVTATQGRWRVGDADLGGASLSVSWPQERGAGRQRAGEAASRVAGPERLGPPERNLT